MNKTSNNSFKSLLILLTSFPKKVGFYRMLSETIKCIRNKEKPIN